MVPSLHSQRLQASAHGGRYRRGRWPTRFRAVPALLLLGLFLVAWLPMPHASAQELTSASIELDGNQLFRVWSSNEYSAAQRVDRPNRLLSQVVQASYPVKISVQEDNNLPVIAINGKPLLTVTGRDTPEGLDKQEQAEIWRKEIQAAIDRGRKQRQPDYVRQMLLVALVCLMAAYFLQRVVGSLGRRILLTSRRNSSSEPRSEGHRFLVGAVVKIVQVTIWGAVVIVAAGFFPASRIATHRLMRAAGETLASPVLPLGDRSYSVLDAIILLTLFILLVKSVGVIQGVLRSRVLQFTGFNAGGQEAIAFIVQFVLLFLGSLVLLQLWGLDLSSLTLFASVLGVGVGLGLQGITKNFISGMIIIFERPIQVGDFVEVGDLQGTVRRLNLRSTEVVTLDRVSIIVPNSEFLESRVINWSHGSPVSRLQIPVGVAYESDCKAVRSALIDACKDYTGILAEPAPRVFFTGFGDSSLNFSLLVWIDQPMRQYEINSDLNFRIEAILRNRKITIPFPQRDLHLKNERLELALPAELLSSLERLSNQNRSQ